VRRVRHCCVGCTPRRQRCRGTTLFRGGDPCRAQPVFIRPRSAQSQLVRFPGGAHGRPSACTCAAVRFRRVEHRSRATLPSDRTGDRRHVARSPDGGHPLDRAIRRRRDRRHRFLAGGGFGLQHARRSVCRTVRLPGRTGTRGRAGRTCDRQGAQYRVGCRPRHRRGIVRRAGHRFGGSRNATAVGAAGRQSRRHSIPRPVRSRSRRACGERCVRAGRPRLASVCEDRIPLV